MPETRRGAEGPSAPELPGFHTPGLLAILDPMGPEQLDELSFGLIVMDRADVVVHYNTVEAQRAGLSPERVVGRNFFADVGPCTNNPLVAGRYHASTDLDEEFDYVFTFRMRVSPVRLRLMAGASSPRRYLAIVPR